MQQNSLIGIKLIPRNALFVLVLFAIKFKYTFVMNQSDISRIIEMAWEDRTPFDAIEHQFGLNEQSVKDLMRTNLKASSYKLWRKRVQGRSTKHLAKREFTVGRHKSYDQNKL